MTTFVMELKPLGVNTKYYTEEAFPEVIGFCTKDPHAHVMNGIEESYEYKLHLKRIYTLKRASGHWELVEFAGIQVVRVSTGNTLGQVLTQALTFIRLQHDNQDDRVNILIPVEKKNLEKAIAIMYYLGGYPVNFLPVTAEMQLLLDRYINPELTFLSYSYVPVAFIPWLSEELKKDGIITKDRSRAILMYKK